MLTPEQFQDLSIIFDTSVEEFEKIYKLSNVDITDEMAIGDVLSGQLREIDYGKIKSILANYPLFDPILLKINIVNEVLNINKSRTCHICEHLNDKVLESFKGTHLYNILSKVDMTESIELQNKKVRREILETISPKSMFKGAITGVKTRSISINESVTAQMNRSELGKKIRQLKEELYTKTPLYAQNKDNMVWSSSVKALKNMINIYESMYGTLEEDLIEPIKPMGTVASDSTPDSLGNKDSSNTQAQSNQNTENSQNNVLDLQNLDKSELAGIQDLLKDMDDNQLKDFYQDMDSEELEQSKNAIEELLK